MTSTMDRLGEGIESRTEQRDGTDDGRRAFRPDIQGLRALAVTLVVLYHCGLPFLPGGYVGVDIFFVISGFLITDHLLGELRRERRISLVSFYARRMRRLLPTALIVIVVTVVLARILGPVLQTARTTTDGFFALAYAMNYRLAAEGIDYQLANAAPSPLQHFWSLAVEEQFYVIWPLGLIVVGWVWRRIGRTALPALVLTAITGIAAVSFVVSLHLTGADAPLAYYSLQSRAWELGVGAALAAVLPALRVAPGWIAAPLTWIGGSACLVGAVLFDDRTPFPGTAALVPVLGAAAVIAGGSSRPSWGLERVLRGRLTQLVGNVSYGWYLWHWSALILAPSIFGHALTLSEKLQVCLLALWFAILTHLVVERPSLRARLPVRRWLAIGLSMSIGTAGLLGGAFVLQPAVAGSGAVVASFELSPKRMQALYTEMQASLNRGVPANLTPSLTAAKDDIPVTSHNGCHVPLLRTRQPSGCVFGDRSAQRSIVLFGDSHAEQWLGAMDRVAKRLHYRLYSWTKVACPVAAVVLDNPQLGGRRYRECGQWRKDRLEAIRQLHPSLVVASQADTVPGSAYNNARWARRTAATLRALMSGTARVAFLQDTPQPLDRDVPACLADHPKSTRACEVRATAGLRKAAPYLVERRAKVSHVVAALGVSDIDPRRWFCLPTGCPAVIGNTLVYRDESHITQAYSRTLAPLLQPVIAKAVRP